MITLNPNFTRRFMKTSLTTQFVSDVIWRIDGWAYSMMYQNHQEILNMRCKTSSLIAWKKMQPYIFN